ncbi:MAG TPA: germination protein YpeB [Candidatus Merdicola faecigallinarum]|uniref:Germination protein YpeB n=1 Tax=Candidatus Merdicola faecigallinarum TaxID=2840862 RepID=A0A9D1S8W3_9FIRM|nr:germination protein YpeB [Candidatus Merdicola faecigallinarum]
MTSLKNKLMDWKNRLKDRHMLTIIVVLLAVILILGMIIYKKQMEYRQASENSYNMAFYELVDYVRNVENYLGKSLISTTPEHGAETLTRVWREANLAQTYLSQLPISSNELENTSKFLNQVSDYSYTLSRKNIYNESLSEEDLKNLKELHQYSVELENTLNQLSSDINEGRIKWGELTEKGSNMFATQVSNISKDSFSNLEQNFHEYAGLIYDGAYSEHITKAEKTGLTGDDIAEEDAKKVVEEFVGQDKIESIESKGLSENTDMPTYDFYVQLKNAEKENYLVISISKKGGHIVFSNYNREVTAETIDMERASEIGKEFLQAKGYPNMKATYYLKEEGILTVNYAYTQDNVTMYPDLIKVKIALDNGEILGIETTGYLNSHSQRNLAKPKVSKEEAKKTLNKELEITSEGLAVIPTEFKTEILCWEFKGKVDGTDFLVYINAENGREEDILTIVDTPNGTLTM